MEEGPYTKAGAIAGIVGLGVATLAAGFGYLGLAVVVKWPPFEKSSAAVAVGHPSSGSQVQRPVRSSSKSLDDVWVAQLASVPVSSGFAQLQQDLAAVRTEIPGARYLDSSEFASLRPGYWVIYYGGSFQNGVQAVQYCAVHGRTDRNQCVGRFLSHDASDSTYECFPPAGSQVAGCYR